MKIVLSPSVWFEPTDPNAVGKIAAIDRSHKSALKYSSPNFVELQQMVRSLNLVESRPIISENDDGFHTFPSKERMSLEEILLECRILGQQVLEQMFETLVVTLGNQGAALVHKTEVSTITTLYTRTYKIK